jgi:iron complex transport system substrate-binding protein
VSAPRLSRRRSLAALTCAIGFVTSCSKLRGAPTAPRVVSISPSATETMFAIGAGALLVGRSKYCDYPPEAASLPVVGGYADPSLEAIVARAPTLVVGARGPAGPALEQALAARSIETFFPETESIAQIEQMISALGKRLGREAGAVEAVARIEAARRRVAAAVAGKPRVRVVLLFDVSPIFAAGPGGFPDDALREAGGENLITQGGAYPTIDIERLLALDPDVVLDGAAEAHGGAAVSKVATLRDTPGWRELRAIREGHVLAISVPTVLRPGPRIGEGLITLARALHGQGAVP